MIVVLHRMKEGQMTESIMPNVALVRIRTTDGLIVFGDGSSQTFQISELYSVTSQKEHADKIIITSPKVCKE